MPDSIVVLHFKGGQVHIPDFTNDHTTLISIKRFKRQY